MEEHVVEAYKNLLADVIIGAVDTYKKTKNVNFYDLKWPEREMFFEVSKRIPEASDYEVLCISEELIIKLNANWAKPTEKKKKILPGWLLYADKPGEISRAFKKYKDHLEAKEFLMQGWIWTAYDNPSLDVNEVFAELEKGGESNGVGKTKRTSVHRNNKNEQRVHTLR